MVNVVPCPSSELQSIEPPIWVTMLRTMAKPRPVPLPTSLVVKKGSKSAT